jgi:hypothetical protein
MGGTEGKPPALRLRPWSPVKRPDGPCLRTTLRKTSRVEWYALWPEGVLNCMRVLLSESNVPAQRAPR